MVEAYPSNMWNRAKWQQERNAARVPQGACPKLSIGDELDRFHADVAKGISLGAEFSAKRLEERARLYAATVRPRHPEWAARVVTQIADRAHAARDEFDKIGKAQSLYNKAVIMVREAWPQAQIDVEDWLESAGDTRLASRHVAILIAGLREISVNGQRLTYVTDKMDRAIVSAARRTWSAADGRTLTPAWLEEVNDLRMRLRPL